MGTRYGRTISLVDPDRWEDDDATILSQAVTMCLSTAESTYRSSPTYGFDVVQAIGDGISETSGRRVGARAADAIEDDERFRAVRVPVDSLLGSDASFEVQIDAFEDGPFELTGPLADETIRERLRQRELEGG